jgi:hypothetical protein
MTAALMTPIFASLLEYKYGITGTLWEPFQLALFPFDTQTLTITLSRSVW